MVIVDGVTYADGRGPGSPKFSYDDMDRALYHATCLAHLDDGGATVHYRIVGDKEEYMITVATERVDGERWELVGDGWEACYTITKPAKPAQKKGRK